MLTYNRFWHFCSTLDNRHYLKISVAAIIVSIASAAIFLPFILSTALGIAAAIIAPVLIVLSARFLIDSISNFFWKRQNNQLAAQKAKSNDPEFKSQVDLYLNRHVICPPNLLKGQCLPSLTPLKASTRPLSLATPLIFPKTVNLLPKKVVANPLAPNRNTGFNITDTSGAIALRVKYSQPLDGLYEVAAREMAELCGFSNIIPANSLTKYRELADTAFVSSTNFAYSDEDLGKLGTMPNKPLSKNAQKRVVQFIQNLKMKVYQTKTKTSERPQQKLMYSQKFVASATDGLTLFTNLFEIGKSQSSFNILDHINQTSFEENFILQIILGSADCNPGNTLFVAEANQHSNNIRMYSIDHERMMPENNYNIAKKIPLPNCLEEPAIENVSPIRLWLAGLPQAEVPFSKDTLKKTLFFVKVNRLRKYHENKKLFSATAVGAQYERVELMRSLFEAELAKDKITLTPLALFLKLVNNHPSYDCLKHTRGLSNFSTFIQVGHFSADAHVSLFQHPLQFLPILLAIGMEQTGQRHPNPNMAIKGGSAMTSRMLKVNEQQNPGVFKELENMTTKLTKNRPR